LGLWIEGAWSETEDLLAWRVDDSGVPRHWVGCRSSILWQTRGLVPTAEGVGACAQAALATQVDAVRPLLQWDEHVGLFFGISLGYEDESAPVNTARTTRSPLSDNVRFDP